jgi:hypothetical protein
MLFSLPFAKRRGGSGRGRIGGMQSPGSNSPPPDLPLRCAQGEEQAWRRSYRGFGMLVR